MRRDGGGVEGGEGRGRNEGGEREGGEKMVEKERSNTSLPPTVKMNNWTPQRQRHRSCTTTISMNKYFVIFGCSNRIEPQGYYHMDRTKVKR